MQVTHGAMAQTGRVRGVVEPHVARGDAPQRRGPVEHHVRQASPEGRDVRGPVVRVHHARHPGAVLAAHAGGNIGAHARVRVYDKQEEEKVTSNHTKQAKQLRPIN